MNRVGGNKNIQPVKSLKCEEPEEDIEDDVEVDRCVDCKCSNLFNTALGTLIDQSSTIMSEISAAAVLVAIGTSNPDIIEDVRQRTVALQTFYLDSYEIALDAFTINNCDNIKCCTGYAIGVSSGLKGITRLTTVNIFNVLTPVGSSTVHAPGTVYGNIDISLEKMRTLVRKQRENARGGKKKEKDEWEF